MQNFKGDPTELKMIGSVEPVLDALSAEKDAMLEGAYSAGPLGDILWVDNRTPLSVSIKQEIFRYSFQGLFMAFQRAGSFEAYIEIFKATFGDQVGVEFTLTDPGKLHIDVFAEGFSDDTLLTWDGEDLITQDGDLIETHNQRNSVLFDALVREVDGDVEALYTLVTEDDEIIGLQLVKGFRSQYELEQMLFEMVPFGVYTTINLIL